MEKENHTQYTLRCCRCGTEIEDDGIMLFHEECKPPGLLQTIYSAARPGPGEKSMGLFQYRDWLPARRNLSGSSATVTYKSRGLAKHLNLENLFISFSGYWPERGASMITCSFKELEAYAVCARLPDNFSDVLVVASAGNTARAFIHVCSKHNIRALIIVPESSLPMLWQNKEPNKYVNVLALSGNSDYTDAILLSQDICRMNGFVPEGGALNVARRDGLGTTVLSCVAEARRIPDEYFQAVGSGTGAIAAWETNVRLNQKKVWPGGLMRLHLSQNFPFTPIYDSWKRQSRELVSVNPMPGASHGHPYASVLSNRKPPYGIAGGLYDALVATKGNVYCITNEEAIAASHLFEQAEGIDIDPAAAVAIACLVKCVVNSTVQTNAYIMLNITGGGFKRLQRDVSLQTIRPIAVIGRADFQNIHSLLVDNEKGDLKLRM